MFARTMGTQRSALSWVTSLNTLAFNWTSFSLSKTVQPDTSHLRRYNQHSTTMSDAAKTPVKKAVKAKKPKAPAAHPPVATMVVAAITALKERNGSSLAAIKKYIAGNYKCDVAKLAPFIRKFLKKAVEDGKLKQIKASYKVDKTKVEKPKPAKKPAAKPKKAKKSPKKAAKPKKAKTPKKEKPAKKEKKAKTKKATKPKKAKTPKKAAAKPKKPAAKKVKKTPKKPAKK